MILFVQKLITKENNNMIREKRDSRLTADISETAHDLLKAAVIKFDSSKGKLVEKMIHNFLSGDAVVTAPVAEIVKVEKPKAPSKRFIPPTVEEVREYCDSRCNNVDPQNFVDHYAGNGWVRGKTKVKCWKACVRTWENKDKPVIARKESLKGQW